MTLGMALITQGSVFPLIHKFNRKFDRYQTLGRIKGPKKFEKSVNRKKKGEDYFM